MCQKVPTHIFSFKRSSRMISVIAYGRVRDPLPACGRASAMDDVNIDCVVCTMLSALTWCIRTVLVGGCCQAYVRRCVTVMASIVQAGVSVMPAGRVKNATCHTHTVKTRRAVAMASVLMARVSVHLASEEFIVSMVSISSCLSTAASFCLSLSHCPWSSLMLFLSNVWISRKQYGLLGCCITLHKRYH